MSRHVIALLAGVALATTALGAQVGERYEPTAAASTLSDADIAQDWTVEGDALATPAGLDADETDTDTIDGTTNPNEHLAHDAVVSGTDDADATDLASSTPDEAQTAPDPEPNEEAEAEQATASSFDPPPGGPSPTGALGIPERALQAYRAGAASYGARCSLGWEVLAGIGRAESGHADGGRLYADGTTWQPILGPVLDGGAFAAISDSDGGRLDGNDEWDRAVGPMQFLPGTWAWIGVDADGDGTADPHDIDDAAATAARYLCLSGGDLTDRDQVRTALLRYNASAAYADAVIAWADGYADRATAIDGPTEPPPESSPTPTSEPASAGDETAEAVEPSSTTDPSPSPAPSPTADPTPTQQPAPTDDPSPSPAPSPTADPTPTEQPTPTLDPAPTDDPAPTADPTPTPDPTAMVDATPAPESTPKSEPTPGDAE